VSGANGSKKTVQVVIETPKGRRNKFKYDPEEKCFKLGAVLPAGLSFPYDFGFLPDTLAEDGDPLDVLLLMDESAFPGCRVQSRLIGVLEIEQAENGEKYRNDRIIAVAENAHDYRDLRSLKDLNENLLKEIEQFFAANSQIKGKEFKLLAARGPKRAHRLIEKSRKKQRAT
jgi:inorganic pyrophosphatase